LAELVFDGGGIFSFKGEPVTKIKIIRVVNFESFIQLDMGVTKLQSLHINYRRD